MNIYRWVLFFSAAIVLASPSSAEDNSRQARNVSLIAVVANPHDYDRELIGVRGWGVIDFEHAAIYLSADDAVYGITENGIWLKLELENEEPKRTRKFVYVEGKFTAGDVLRGFAGTLSGVKSIFPLERESNQP